GHCPRPTIALLPQPCRRRGKRFVNASREPAQTAHRFGRRARGRQRASSRGNDVPVVILLRSRIDSEMCRQRAQAAKGKAASGATAKTPVFWPLQAQRSLSFLSRIISLSICAFRASEEGKPSWRAKRRHQ